MKCTHCGNEITGNAQFCGICGQKVEQPQQPAFNPPPVQQQWQQPTAQGYQGSAQQSGKKKPKKKKGKAIVAIVLAVILIIGGTTGGILAAKIMNNPMKKIYSGVSGMTSSNKAYKLTGKGTVGSDGDIYNLSGSAVIKTDRNGKTIAVSDLTGAINVDGEWGGIRNFRGLYDASQDNLYAGWEYYEPGRSIELYLNNGMIAQYSDSYSATESGFRLNYILKSIAQMLFVESQGQSTFESLNTVYETMLRPILDDSYDINTDLDEESFNACQKKFVKSVADKKWLEENLGYRKDGDEHCFSISKKSLDAVLDIYDEFIQKSGLTDAVEDLVYELDRGFFDILKKLEISFKTGKNMLESLGLNLIMEDYSHQMKINGTVTFEEASDPVVDTDAIEKKVKDAEEADSYNSYNPNSGPCYEPHF